MPCQRAFKDFPKNGRENCASLLWLGIGFDHLLVDHFSEPVAVAADIDDDTVVEEPADAALWAPS